MRFAPYEQPGAAIKPIMGIDIHFVPSIHGLFVGPIECARHSFGYMADDPHSSYLVVDDLRTALGETEGMVYQAVEALLEADPSINGFVLGTACQTPFLGIDMDALCRSLSAQFNKGFCHYLANRMSAENTPGPTRKDMPGNDRYHTRRALMTMLEDAPRAATGLNLLGTSALESEILGLGDALGVQAILSSGDLASYQEFQQMNGAKASLVTNVSWLEPAQYLQERFGIPFLYAPTSYNLQEIDQQYAALGDLVGKPNLAATPALAQAREEAQGCVQETRDLLKGEPLNLELTYVARPWSLLCALLDYGFELGPVGFDWVRIRRVEQDDEAAFQRIAAEHPEIIENAYVLQLRQQGVPDAAAPYIKRGVMSKKYDEQGRPQGFGKKAHRPYTLPGKSDERKLADARAGLHVPGEPDPWMGIPEVFGEQRVWGYAAVKHLMGQIQAAFCGETGPHQAKQAVLEASLTAEPSPAQQASMRGLWHDAVPFATDTNGATSVFMDLPALVIPQDSNGSASTLKRMFQPETCKASVMALNLFDTHYTLGREEDFQECMIDLDKRAEQDMVVLVHGPVSRLLGVDLNHRAALLEHTLGKPVYFLETSGNEAYDKGLARAYDFIWQQFAQPAQDAAANSPRCGVNLLGLNLIDHPDAEFRNQALHGAEAAYGQVKSVWGCLHGPQQWKQATSASLNVVASVSALKCAKTLQRETGTPFITLDETDWFDSWADLYFLAGAPRILVVGEQITGRLLRRLLLQMGAQTVDVASFFQMDKSLMAEGDTRLRSEADLRAKATQGYDLVICDGALVRFCSVPVFTLTHLPVCFGHAESHGLRPGWLADLMTAWNSHVTTATASDLGKKEL